MNQIQKARVYQRAAHSACGQRRKFSGLPYHTHPQAVENLLVMHVPDVDENMRVAALLHDVIEDTGVTAGELCAEFGDDVAQLVVNLTNKKTPGLNRAAQKIKDAARLAESCARTKTIKLADRLHNLPDIIRHDKGHAKVYVPETRHLLETALVGGNQNLWNRVDAICSAYEAEIA